MLGYIFTLAMTAYGVGYGWLNPVVGLMVYYCFAVLRPAHLWFWSVGESGGRYLLMVAVATIIGWLINGMGDWSKIKYVKWPMLGLLVYLLAGAVGTFFIAENRDVAWKFYEPQIKSGFIVLLALTLFTTARTIQIFAWVITLSFGYLAYSLNERYLEYPPFLLFMGWGGIDNNGAGMIMVMGVPLTLFMGLHARNWLVRGLCFFFTLCLIHVVLFSFSRGAQLGLIIVGLMTFVAIFIALPNKGLTLLLSVLAVVITLALAGAEVREEFWTIFASPEERDESAASRYVTWAAGWRCMLDNPMGVGPRNFNLIANQYGLARGKSIHNLYLQTGADYGFAGMFGLMLFYFGAAWQAFLLSISAAAKQLGWPRHFGQMVCISIAGFAICSMFIGMETVEHGFVIGAVGLCTVAYVRDLALREAAFRQMPVPELQQVPLYEPTPIASARFA
jgi:hypothetical protein